MKVSFLRKEKDPTVVHGMKVPYAPAKRHAAKLRWYIILLLVSSPLIYFLIKLGLAWMIVAAPGYITMDQVEINSKADGIVDHVHVQVGQDIAAGETVVRLFNPHLASQMMLRRAELSALAPEELMAGSAQVDLLKRRVSLAKENVSVAKAYLNNVDFLFGQGAATVAELNLARERRNRTQIEYDEALFDYRRLSDGSGQTAANGDRSREVARKRIEAQIESLERDQGRLVQTTPFAGRVLDVLAREGESLSNGLPILLLGRAETPYVEAYLEPKYASLARRLPSDLTSPIGSRDMMLMVRLDLIEPLPDIQWIHGLPVSVRFRFRSTIF